MDAQILKAYLKAKRINLSSLDEVEDVRDIRMWGTDKILFTLQVKLLDTMYGFSEVSCNNFIQLSSYEEFKIEYLKEHE
jgi:hypothetical protein